MNPGSDPLSLWFHLSVPPLAHLINGDMDRFDLRDFLWALNELLCTSTQNRAELSVIAQLLLPT